MKWDSVNITDKVYYLKELMGNTTDCFDSTQYHIVDALITGSQNTYSGDMAFSIEEHHINYMRKLWNKAMDNQLDTSVVLKIKKKLINFN